MSDEAERTLCQLPHVHVFRIPVRKSADGHRASDWPKDPTWTGKLKIVAKGKVAAVVLLDANNQVFAVCKVTDDAAVERTLDSGRYFVLRITNDQGRHAFIGIAFNERNDAFDFNVALSEFKNELEREELANKMSHDVPVGPMKDLSLKEGEKIKIKIAVKKKNLDEDGNPIDASSSQSAVVKPLSGGLLPPPKGMLSPPPVKNAAPVAQSFNSSSGSSGAFDSFGSFGSNDPFASPAKVTPPNDGSGAASTVFGFGPNDPFATASSSASTTSGFNSDPFGSSDPFGASNDPFASGTAKAPTPAKPTPANPSPSAAAASVSTQSKGDVANLLDF